MGDSGCAVALMENEDVALDAMVSWVIFHGSIAAIAYLVEENRVLREQLGSRRRRLTDDERRRPAAKGKAMGCRLLGQVATIVIPDSMLRCHRRLIAAKHT